MSKATKIAGILVAVVVVLIGALAIAVSTFDINRYRDQIADALGKQTGRAVAFGGPIKLDLSMHGIGVAVDNASIGNPSWASRPQMAGIGKLELGVALLPLIRHQLVVTKLDVSNADIQLETNAAGQHNWDMQPTTAAGAPPAPAAMPATASSSSSGAVGIRIDRLSIADSQIAMRGKDGGTSVFKVKKMTMGPSSRGVAVTVDADYNGAPVTLDLKTGAANLMADSKWPFEADLAYANDRLKAQGTADIGGKTVTLASYELSAGGSALHGQLTAGFGGAKTELHGTIAGDKLDPADFKPPAGNGGENAAAPAVQEPAAGAKRLFSASPLDLSALQAADVSLDANIGAMTLGKTELKQVSGTLALANGELTLAPLKAMLGDSALQADIKLDAAASPARYSLTFKAPGVDLASLLKMSGMDAFLSGKGDADIELSGSGNSLHDMAASASGHILITAADGKISAAAASGIASGLAQIFAPGDANPTLNCVAVRFNVTDGVGKDNGILADSSASTVGGTGGFNLGAETVDITLSARPKLINARGLTPAVDIKGQLTQPKINIDTASIVQNVAGLLMKGNIGGGASSVPAMQTAPQGQNACIYTLDHRSAAAAAPQNGAAKTVTGQGAAGIRNIGKQLQGLFSH